MDDLLVNLEERRARLGGGPAATGSLDEVIELVVLIVVVRSFWSIDWLESSFHPLRRDRSALPYAEPACRTFPRVSASRSVR